jgi:hypothetical protein
MRIPLPLPNKRIMNKGFLLKVTKGQRWQDLGSQYGNNEAKDNSAEGLNTVLKRPSSGPK